MRLEVTIGLALWAWGEQDDSLGQANVRHPKQGQVIDPEVGKRDVV